MERPTFSPFWHRVAASRPRLRPHVQITRQLYRRGRWHVAHDPASNQFYKLNPIAHEFVCSLDGGRTVDEAWRLILSKHADAAPTQNEAIELLGQLYANNLLSIDAAPEAEQLLKRSTERRSRKNRQQLAGLMYLRVKVFNPDRMLTWLEPIFRPVLSTFGLVAWAVLVLAALWSVAPEWRRLASGIDQLSNPTNWAWIFGVFVLLKAWHELGHGLICKRFGGQVPETGFLMMIFIPSPYVDASSAWALTSKWKRALVGAGGMIFEIAAASVCALLWVSAPEGTLLKELTYYAMISASVSTVLFNANPLMRFDGYFILSDLIEVPNLMQRSMQMMKFLFQRHLYRIPNSKPPTSSTGEALILLVFGVLSLAYRMFLFAVIIFFLLSSFLLLGVVLALWSIVVWFLMPLGKWVHWLASHASLSESRSRAITVSIVLTAAVVLLVGTVPLPDWRRTTGVIEPVDRRGVFAGSDGFVKSVEARLGERVKAGDVIATLESPEMQSEIALAEANIRILQMNRREALADADPGAARLAEQQSEVWRSSLTELQRRSRELIIRSPIDGVIVTADPARALGGHLTIGTPICEVADTDRTRITATLDQTQAAWFFELPSGSYTLRMRPASDPSRVITATSATAIPGAQSRLPHAALGAAGGGDVSIRPDDPSGRTTMKEQFTIKILAPESDLANLAPGQRVAIRATLPSKPLLHQVIDRVAKSLQGRVKI